MTAAVLDGELLAARIRGEVTDRVARLRASGVEVGLGTILVGEDGPSERYVAMKHADCAEVGIRSVHEHLRPTSPRPTWRRWWPGSMPTPPSTPIWSSCRCPPDWTRSGSCWPWTPTRTWTGSTRSTWVAW